jgi:hypothetical protein
MSENEQLTQKTFDISRIAFIAARAVNDGYQSDIYVMPEAPETQFISIPCLLSVKVAAEHFNKEGEGSVNLIHLQSYGTAINSKTIAQMDLTPNAFTNAFVSWKTDTATMGVPVRLNPNQIRDVDTDINVGRLRAAAEQNVLGRGFGHRRASLSRA